MGHRRSLISWVMALGLVAVAPGCASETATEDEAEEGASSEAAQTAAGELAHGEHDTPVPSWSQATRSWDGSSNGVRTTLIRMLGGDEARAKQRFDGWTPTVRRGFVLVIDKLANEGWLDSIDTLIDEPFDTAFHFRSRTTSAGTLEQIMVTKARAKKYIENDLANGGFAYLNSWNHEEWRRAWAESDVANAGLHVGVFADGHWEVHAELYNPMFVEGAPLRDLFWAPGFGWVNRRLFLLHQRLEAGSAASNRRSANYYHFMKRADFPLSF